MDKKQNEEVIFVDMETLSEEEMLQGDSYEREDDSDEEELQRRDRLFIYKVLR